MKIAVLGSTGMAGHIISKYLEERGHEVFRTSRSEQNTKNSKAIDVTDFDSLKEFLQGANPDAVINCVGLLQKSSDARPDLAVLINSYLPHWLERLFIDSKTKIVHLSTDCVFSGKDGKYKENDVTDGTTTYDRSKALGELINDKDLTMRQSIIGPDIDPKGTGLFNWFMQQKGEISGWSKSIWSGVSTLELARGIEAALGANLTGLYHFVPEESIDKYSLLNLMKKAFEKEDIAINKTDGITADKSLVNTREDFDFEVREYSRQIEDMKNWVYEHRNLYSHYF